MANARYEDFITKKALQEGKVYVHKDGRLSLFVGYGDYNEFIFYELAHVLFVSVGGGVDFAHGKVQVEHLSYMCEAVMKQEISLKSLLCYKSFPQLYGEFSYVSYDSELVEWWSRNKKSLGSKLPTIPNLEGGGKVKSLFVSAKDLVPGEFYYTGDSWRSIFLYLGRDRDGLFCWYYVGDPEGLLRGGTCTIGYSNTYRTKANKKCKLLKNIYSDKDASISYRDKILVGRTVDVSGLDLG